MTKINKIRPKQDNLAGKINNFDLPLLALKRQEKKFCYVIKAIKKTIAICSADKSKNLQLILLNAIKFRDVPNRIFFI